MYNKALKNAPSDTTILLSRSLAHMLSSPPQLDLALQDADAAIQINPTHWHGWQQKGATLQRKGDFQGAEEALMNAVGFATGVEKVAAQGSLADARARRDQSSPVVELPSSSVPSISPTPHSSLPVRPAPTSIPATPPSNTQFVPQRSASTKLPAAASSGTAATTATSFATPSASASKSATLPLGATSASTTTNTATNVSSRSPPWTSRYVPSGTPA